MLAEKFIAIDIEIPDKFEEGIEDSEVIKDFISNSDDYVVKTFELNNE